MKMLFKQKKIPKRKKEKTQLPQKWERTNSNEATSTETNAAHLREVIPTEVHVQCRHTEAHTHAQIS